MIPDEFADSWPTDSDWTTCLQPTLESPAFASLARYVDEQRNHHTVYPAASDVFNAFRYTTCAKTKVVILGQDPYHGPGQAHGLSFSVKENLKLPPSLRNIFRELASDLQIMPPLNGNLRTWADEGVLLLNTVLTVRQGEAHSHRRQGWEVFTDGVIGRLVAEKRKIVFVLWGKPAQSKSNLITTGHEKIMAPHPSPLSAHRGFFGSRPFSRINQALVESGQSPIRWDSICASSSI